MNARILIVDNYDSFTHNLFQGLRVLGADVTIVRNDETSVDAVASAGFLGIVLSPGPCTPNEAGITVPLVRGLAGTIPMLGVCLGHQAIAQAFGAHVVRADHPRHGRASSIRHDGRGSLARLPSPFEAGRYHSLVVDAATLPRELSVTATSEDDGCVMAFFDAARELEGLQFHPESILTPEGDRVLAGWLQRLSTRPREPHEPCERDAWS